jgi:uncharacterized protein YciI
MLPALAATLLAGACASTAPPPAMPPGTGAGAYDEALARSLGADERGIRRYVFVLLKTGPTRVPAGPERDAMFKGHFDNIERLAKAGTLAVAGPFDGVDGWRGLFILAVTKIDEAKAIMNTDPVVQKGEMVAEYHVHYGSAGLMAVTGVHERIRKP